MFIKQSLPYFININSCGIWSVSNHQQCRALWGYVAIAFNRVDADRLKLVGPDRLCAEWLLKNGGGVRLTNNPNILWKDYNSLPPENHKFNVKVADCSNSSIMKIGLDHFAGCKYIDTVIFHKNNYLESGSLDGLLHLNNSLLNLQISACDDLQDCDLKIIGRLSNLRTLFLYDMTNVKDMENVVKEIQIKIPNCEIKLKNKTEK